MPKVTLNAKPWCKRHMVFGKNTIVFHGEKPKTVTAAVALACDKVYDKGKKVFTVQEMPKVVTGKSVRPINQNVETSKKSKPRHIQTQLI
jgi:hypothetical protein